ncbi:LysM peptidoglycan-binding domain-containing protein [Chryseobacterium indologenes]|uniref:LysM peptidoglycan-binding domain-containing protein n=1 Tax=Chryseobacterium indologenes TaxID=253 RepID=UPI001108AE69|nr:LysM domain-containing protein [Chryseobacterium indologenes]TLX25455.1 LysM peptidoglycan-binding domain-containing protein [Chryseobacterium indologenes]
MQKFNIHTVQENDTLKSIAALYGIDKDALKLFHNNLCSVRDMVLIELTGQKEIFIPRASAVDQDKKVPLGRANSLVFNPAKIYRKYGAVVTIENGDHLNELKYEVSVRWIRSERRQHYFEINRISKIYLNEEEVNEIADMLAYQTSKVLYPLQISTDEHGKFKTVENLSVFKERWPAVKEAVYKEFDGETVDRYCRQIEKVLDAPETLNLYLKNDYFIRTLFYGIYQSFGEDFSIEEIQSFPITDNPIEPKYKIKLELDPLKDDHNLIRIDGTGKLHEERSASDFMNGAPFSMIIDDEPVMNDNGEFRVRYYLDEKTIFPESMYLESSILLRQEKKISVSIAALPE